MNIYCFKSAGNKFCHGHLVRAVCCRLPDSINSQLPVGYSLRHPYVGRVSVYVPAKEALGRMSQNLSINWCAEDKLIEVVDARTGLSIPE
jgi:Adenosine-deaminase (editase) domain